MPAELLLAARRALSANLTLRSRLCPAVRHGLSRRSRSVHRTLLLASAAYVWLYASFLPSFYFSNAADVYLPPIRTKDVEIVNVRRCIKERFADNMKD